MKNIILIYITNPSKREAKILAKTLLKKRLIACANIFPIDSLYWWKKKIADEREFILIAKTLEKKIKALEKEIEKIQPYSVPCVIKISAHANEKYFRWLNANLT